ncbi:prepilin peptidase CpaA [Dyella jiangningensis]|uniref:prepilin peptidase n=1 Tax=Dyella sp. AtDHG13 TaxID=1938897 RepID=UPI0008874299|nr:prepilin peptidase [Dyella sp. AtDHG13]PXV55332.1 prepilin peptidase CpaA [Dyella sp. AtDHG13]SDK80473.1 prepilin peptidase CpaA [Dyella jiangningensis]
MTALLPTLAVILSAFVALSDLYARRVPNTWLAAALLAAIAAPGLQWVVGASPVWPSVPGLAIGLITMLPFYAIRWMGAGDVKFFATLGLLLGARALLPIWAIACLLTGVHAFVVLVLRTPRFAYAPGLVTARQHLYAMPLWRRAMEARQGRMGQPHATYLGIATLLVVLHPELMHWGQA